MTLTNLCESRENVKPVPSAGKCAEIKSAFVVIDWKNTHACTNWLQAIGLDSQFKTRYLHGTFPRPDCRVPTNSKPPNVHAPSLCIFSPRSCPLGCPLPVFTAPGLIISGSYFN